MDDQKNKKKTLTISTNISKKIDIPISIQDQKIVDDIKKLDLRLKLEPSEEVQEIEK